MAKYDGIKELVYFILTCFLLICMSLSILDSRKEMEGCWKEHKTPDGRIYEFCTCGSVCWDRGDKCMKGHPRGYIYKIKPRKKRFSGHSAFQDQVGGFQRSNRA